MTRGWEYLPVRNEAYVACDSCCAFVVGREVGDLERKKVAPAFN